MRTVLKNSLILLLLSQVTACQFNRVLSNEIDGLCLITQQDMVLGHKKLKTRGITQYVMNTPDTYIGPTTIGYKKIAIIPRFTKMSVYKVFKSFEMSGIYKPDMLVKLDQGKYQGTIVSIPTAKGYLGVIDPVTNKELKQDGRYVTKDEWVDAWDTEERSGEFFYRSDVHKIKYNADYLKKCNQNNS